MRLILVHFIFSDDIFLLKLKDLDIDINRIAHKCPECGKDFTRKSELQDHLMTVHSIERPIYECSLCHST